MALSTRRRLFSIAGAAALFGITRSARAQTDCTVGFVNGLLSYGDDCSTISIPGDVNVSPPSHLTTAITAAADATTDANALNTERVEDLERRRSRRRNNKQDTRSNQQQQRSNKKDGKQRRREAREDALIEDAKITCDDFDIQEDAQAYFDEFKTAALDPNGDKVACSHLPSELD